MRGEEKYIACPAAQAINACELQSMRGDEVIALPHSRSGAELIREIAKAPGNHVECVLG